jgi:hypothetical protein
MVPLPRRAAKTGLEADAPKGRFRLPEIEVTSYRGGMTAPTEVHIAGVPWPTYKVLALVVGAVVFLAVGVVTASAAPAVLSGTAAAVAVWVGQTLFRSSGA